MSEYRSLVFEGLALVARGLGITFGCIALTVRFSMWLLGESMGAGEPSLTHSKSESVSMNANCKLHILLCESVLCVFYLILGVWSQALYSRWFVVPNTHEFRYMHP